VSDRERSGAPDDRGPAGQEPLPWSDSAPGVTPDATPGPPMTAPGSGTQATPQRTPGESVDVDRRSFFRSFSRDAVQAAAQLVGAATALQRGSLAATGQLFGGGAPSDPFAQLLGLDDPAAVPPVVPFRSPYRYLEGELTLVDQRRLPDELVEVTCHTGAEVAACIRDRLVRGGPVLAQVAAYGVLVAAERMRSSTRFIRAATLHGTINALRSSRPSSRPMEAALDRMLATWQAVGEEAPGDAAADALRAEADAIADEAMLDHAALGRAGAAVLPIPFERHLELLVHGPVGALAGGALGTALAIVQEIQVQGHEVHAWVPEGRPAFQGARITAFELARLEVAHTVIADAAAAGIIARGRVDAILVAADRIARNGDVSASVGTYPLAAVAARHGVPVYVCAPLCTVDLRVGDEWGFMEEERPVEELADINGRRIPPGESRVNNPVLDVTPAALVRGFVTELGVLAAPFEQSLAGAVERRRSGSPPPPGQVHGEAPVTADAEGSATLDGAAAATGAGTAPAEDEDGWGP
jgi:methylthioribose-1-phosphate isomerase